MLLLEDPPVHMTGGVADRFGELAASLVFSPPSISPVSWAASQTAYLYCRVYYCSGCSMLSTLHATLSTLVVVNWCAGLGRGPRRFVCERMKSPAVFQFVRSESSAAA